jgi:hypothetical protein
MRPLLILFLLLSVMPPSTGMTVAVPRDLGVLGESRSFFTMGVEKKCLRKTVVTLVAPPWWQTCERWHLWNLAKEKGFRDDFKPESSSRHGRGRR